MAIHINSYRSQQEYSPETKYFIVVGKKSSERRLMSEKALFHVIDRYFVLRRILAVYGVLRLSS